jgi:hypothetical protein
MKDSLLRILLNHLAICTYEGPSNEGTKKTDARHLDDYFIRLPN